MNKIEFLALATQFADACMGTKTKIQARTAAVTALKAKREAMKGADTENSVAALRALVKTLREAEAADQTATTEVVVQLDLADQLGTELVEAIRVMRAESIR